MIARLARSTAGSTAAEFGLVLPLLIVLLLGTIDVGRFLWACNRAEKATQMGVRYAVATNIVPGGLTGYSFATAGGIPQGDPIPQSAFGGVQCQSSGGTVTCACNAGATCPPLGTINTAAFTNIVTRMQRFYPSLTADNVKLSYEYSGLGYAGDPNGSDVAPLVTVKLTGVTFAPMLFAFFGNATVTLPSFGAALTIEDGSGTNAE